MRLLIAISGWPYSELVVQLASHMAGRAGETPTVLTVIRELQERRRARSALKRARAVLETEVPSVDTKIRAGHPAEQIIREAEEGHYDLIIVGDRQHRHLARFVLGSTAERVMEHSPCPVLIAKGKVQPIRHVLLCDSGAQSPSLLDRFSTQLAEMVGDGVEITVLHVMSQMSAGPGVRGKQLRAEAEDLVREHTPEGEMLAVDVHILEELNLSPYPKVRHGLVVNEILEEARTGDYQLVVIGASRCEGWQRILLDDLAHRIISQVDRPILVVR